MPETHSPEEAIRAPDLLRGNQLLLARRRRRQPPGRGNQPELSQAFGDLLVADRRFRRRRRWHRLGMRMTLRALRPRQRKADADESAVGELRRLALLGLQRPEVTRLSYRAKFYRSEHPLCAEIPFGNRLRAPAGLDRGRRRRKAFATSTTLEQGALVALLAGRAPAPALSVFSEEAFGGRGWATRYRLGGWLNLPRVRQRVHSEGEFLGPAPLDERARLPRRRPRSRRRRRRLRWRRRLRNLWGRLHRCSSRLTLAAGRADGQVASGRNPEPVRARRRRRNRFYGHPMGIWKTSRGIHWQRTRVLRSRLRRNRGRLLRAWPREHLPRPRPRRLRRSLRAFGNLLDRDQGWARTQGHWVHQGWSWRERHYNVVNPVAWIWREALLDAGSPYCVMLRLSDHTDRELSDDYRQIIRERQQRHLRRRPGGSEPVSLLPRLWLPPLGRCYSLGRRPGGRPGGVAALALASAAAGRHPRLRLWASSGRGIRHRTWERAFYLRWVQWRWTRPIKHHLKNWDRESLRRELGRPWLQRRTAAGDFGGQTFGDMGEFALNQLAEPMPYRSWEVFGRLWRRGRAGKARSLRRPGLELTWLRRKAARGPLWYRYQNNIFAPIFYAFLCPLDRSPGTWFNTWEKDVEPDEWLDQGIHQWSYMPRPWMDYGSNFLRRHPGDSADLPGWRRRHR